jgi:Tol biopolymer transport system component
VGQTLSGLATVSRVWKITALAAIVILVFAIALAVLLGSRENGANLAQYRYTPFATTAKLQGAPIWSPNGKAIAYLAKVEGKIHLFVRYVASPAATDLGVHGDRPLPLRWSPDSRRIFFSTSSASSTSLNSKQGFYSMSVFGGDPAFIMDTPLNDYAAGAFSPDNRSVAAFCRRSGDDKVGVFVSSPVGSTWRRYQPDPFATTAFYSGPS